VHKCHLYKTTVIVLCIMHVDEYRHDHIHFGIIYAVEKLTCTFTLIINFRIGTFTRVRHQVYGMSSPGRQKTMFDTNRILGKYE
jgi:hypothetical protein